MLYSPLHSHHQAAGARFVADDGWEVPAGFLGLDAEYRTATQGVALADRSPIGRLQATGPDVLDLLNRLSTNRVDPLDPGTGAATALTTNKGRIIDWITVLHPGDRTVILTSPPCSEAVGAWIDRYTIIEDVTVEDVTPSTALIGVLGPAAEAVVEEVLGPSAAELPPLGCRTVPWGAGALLVARTSPLGVPGYDLMVDAGDAAALWDALAEAGAAHGVQPIGLEAMEALRVENGLPRWGQELGEAYNPLEAGLTESVSWTKGCYIGQEVVARLWTYHKVQKYLVSLTFQGNSEARPAPGAALHVGDARVGALTSVTFSPGAGALLGLGYLRAAHATVGQAVEVPLEDGRLLSGVVTRVAEKPTAPVPSLVLAEFDDDDLSV